MHVFVCALWHELGIFNQLAICGSSSSSSSALRAPLCVARHAGRVCAPPCQLMRALHLIWFSGMCV